MLTDERLRRELRRKGLARAQQFSWETSVRRVRDIYQQVGDVQLADGRRSAAAAGEGIVTAWPSFTTG